MSERRLKSMALSVAIVGVKDGLGRGKMTFDYFLPPFEKTLQAFDIRVQHYSYREFILLGQRHDAAILLYGEVHARKNLHVWNTIEEAARAAGQRKIALVHAPSIGRIVADKTLTNEALSNAAIEMPKARRRGCRPFQGLFERQHGIACAGLRGRRASAARPEPL
jgi:hypothetical protein